MSLMHVVKVLIGLCGFALIMLSVPVGLIAGVALIFVGFFLLYLAVMLKAPRKHVVEYFRAWDAELKKGIEPVDPLRDAPAHYIKVVPDGQVRRVIQVTLDAEKGDRGETVVEEMPLW